MVRTKAVAVLLGPSGIGLVGLYVSITGLVSTIAQLGIDQSGVREVAEANGSGDPERVARVVKTLRRVCWLTGILGWLLTVLLAWPLSQWTFGSAERMWAVAILGVTVLIGAVTGGQTALLQGMRRIGDLARIQVLSAVVTTFIAVGLYAWLGEQGIIPVIILTSLVQLGFSWYFSRKVQIAELPQAWTETAAESKRLIGLGTALMYGAVITGIAGLAIRSLIVRDLGIDAAGIYQAAWGLSGMFAGFIIAAMGTDFYPILTAKSDDHASATKLVNEQTEIGVLLAFPGVLISLAFAPLLMHLFYSKSFASGSEMLPWLLLSIFLRMITYPMGYVLLAKNAGIKYALMMTLFHMGNIALSIALLPVLKLNGVVIANFVLCLLYMFLMRKIVGVIIDFKWSQSTSKIIMATTTVVVVSFMVTQILSDVASMCINALIAILSCIYTLRNIASRLGEKHRLVNMACRLHFGRYICGFK